MPQTVCYRLVARSPFHIGDRGVGMEVSSVVLHSDTLFSALILTLRESGYDLNVLLSHFPQYRDNRFLPGDTPFLLSSGFPFSGSVYFFPRPLIRPHGINAEGSPRLGKTLKKVKFFSREIFQKLISGQPLDKEWLEEESKPEMRIRPELLVQSGKAWITPYEAKQLSAIEEPYTGKTWLWSEGARPAVTVDRLTNRSQVFATGQVRFPANSGLFFLVSYKDLSWKPVIENALSILQETGIGGERSRGHGQFSLEIDEDFSLAEPDLSNGFTTLSLLWVLEAEIKKGVLSGSSYDLVNRRGWVGSPGNLSLAKRSVLMLGEGSVFSRFPQGAMVDVGPLDTEGNTIVKHKVWQYGLGYQIRCRIHD